MLALNMRSAFVGLSVVTYLLLLATIMLFVWQATASGAAAPAQSEHRLHLNVHVDGDDVVVTADGGPETVVRVDSTDASYSGEGTYHLDGGDEVRLPYPERPMEFTVRAEGKDATTTTTIRFERVTVGCGDETSSYVAPSAVHTRWTVDRGDRTVSQERRVVVPTPERCELPAVDRAEAGSAEELAREAAAAHWDDHGPDDDRESGAAPGLDDGRDAYNESYRTARDAYNGTYRDARDGYNRTHDAFVSAYERGDRTLWGTYESATGGDSEEPHVKGTVDEAYENGTAFADQVHDDAEAFADQVRDDAETLAGQVHDDVEDDADRIADDGKRFADRLYRDANETVGDDGGDGSPGDELPDEGDVPDEELPDEDDLPEGGDAPEPSPPDDGDLPDGLLPDDEVPDVGDGPDDRTEADADTDAHAERDGTDVRVRAGASASAQHGDAGASASRSVTVGTEGSVDVAPGVARAVACLDSNCVQG